MPKGDNQIRAAGFRSMSALFIKAPSKVVRSRAEPPRNWPQRCACGSSCEVEVQDLVDAYMGKAEALSGRRLEWQRDDLPLQNIQARSAIADGLVAGESERLSAAGYQQSQ